MNPWICCQLGAREHYAIPRALYINQQLELLITDVWLSENSRLNFLPESLLTKFKRRYHPELNTASIESFNYLTVKHELSYRRNKIDGWNKIIDRNSWWQQQVIKKLKEVPSLDQPITLFAYSYAAQEIFRYAKERGWHTVLGQIDPGIAEEKLIYEKAQKKLSLQQKSNLAPLQYWSNWREECRLADRIMVNSQWSKQALHKTGISEEKITIIPLAYKATPTKYKRTYPLRFTTQRPLKVLFLGQIIIRKGISEIIEAIALLNNFLDSGQIEFCFVGEIKIDIPKQLQNHPQIKWLGSVPHNQTSEYYQQADVFLFPTHSDGFGITQLEAQSWQLPIIASQFCGAVVKSLFNGLILPQVTPEMIAKAIVFCLENPQELAKYSRNSNQILPNFSLEKLAERMANIKIN